ncbi:hypothetical protein NQ156_00230 [Microbacterium sp. zg.Y625]|uniref:hypothetical protein n=1 Tax=Microbacterium jiangjiandongii TaxID=3049071 RepID=UPI00214BFA9F|nr:MULTISPECIES: hypothetical protein [unclassified Microbacterium]MCR2791488.1 hypothetical protein [Microbacterium sp. zg.Y625]MCR2817059.1 hypothetical protein [Microbacterium sp. zg.Y843]WIM24321.1 hypothetical protein QNO14_09150 [Microbacterium sp. zg-Y625]
MLSVIDALALMAASVPTPESTVDPELVTPGPAGFAAIAFIALAVILLVWDMLRRVRRGRYRAEVREELDAEEQGSGRDDSSGTPPTR